MVSLLTIVHICVCIFLIIIVLLQHGKGADMGATFGGGSGQTVFGTDGPLPLLNKITTGSAILFMITSVTLAYYSANTTKGSVMEEIKATPPPIEKTIEVAPTPVEIPMEKSASTDSDTTAPTPATFPGDSAAPTPVEPQGETVPSHK